MHFTDDMAAGNSFPPQGGWGGVKHFFSYFIFLLQSNSPFQGISKIPKIFETGKMVQNYGETSYDGRSQHSLIDY